MECALVIAYSQQLAEPVVDDLALVGRLEHQGDLVRPAGFGPRYRINTALGTCRYSRGHCGPSNHY